MVETHESIEEIEVLLERARQSLRSFEDGVDYQRLLMRLRTASPLHPVLLFRSLFGFLALLCMIAGVVIMLVPLLNTDLARLLVRFESVIPYVPDGVPALPAVFGLLATCMVVGWAMCTGAALAFGREAQMLPWEQRQHQQLVNEVTRLTTQRAVMQRIRNTPVSSRPRIASPMPSAMRSRGPSSYDSPPSAPHSAYGGFSRSPSPAYPPRTGGLSPGGASRPSPSATPGGFGRPTSYGAPAPRSTPSPSLRRAQEAPRGAEPPPAAPAASPAPHSRTPAYQPGRGPQLDIEAPSPVAPPPSALADRAAQDGVTDPSLVDGSLIMESPRDDTPVFSPPPPPPAPPSELQTVIPSHGMVGHGMVGHGMVGHGMVGLPPREPPSDGGIRLGAAPPSPDDSADGQPTERFNARDLAVAGLGEEPAGAPRASAVEPPRRAVEATWAELEELGDDPDETERVEVSVSDAETLPEPDPSVEQRTRAETTPESLEALVQQYPTGEWGEQAAEALAEVQAAEDDLDVGPQVVSEQGPGSSNEEPDPPSPLSTSEAAAAGLAARSASEPAPDNGILARARAGAYGSRATPYGSAGRIRPNPTVSSRKGAPTNRVSQQITPLGTPNPAVPPPPRPSPPSPPADVDATVVDDEEEDEDSPTVLSHHPATDPGSGRGTNGISRTQLPDPTQVRDQWLRDALSKAEQLAANFPVQAQVVYGQEPHLPFTLVVNQATPAMAVRAMVNFVEFLAGIYTPPRARIELVSVPHLDRSFHRNVEAALEPYFGQNVVLDATPGRVDIQFTDPDPGWGRYPQLPMR